MKIELRYVNTPSGNLAYRIADQRQRRALICVHGAAGDARLFHGQLKYFGKEVTVLSLDLPCHGKSTGKSNLTIRDYSESITAVMEHEDLTDCVLIGHSMGGCVALEFYQNHRERVKGMVLVGTSAKLPVSDELSLLLNTDIEAFSRRVINMTFSKDIGILTSLFKNGLIESRKDAIFNDMIVSRSVDFTHLIEEIDVPVLCLANRGDQLIPYKLTKKMCEKIPGGEFHLYDYKGHMPFFEYKDEFNRSAAAFIAKHGLLD